MTKRVVLSVDGNPKYKVYQPLVMWAWRQFGWDPLLLSFAHSLNSVTMSQVSRLYAAHAADSNDDYVMLSDFDMLPLSDYWIFNPDTITAWGRDLTDYHYPMCYVGMKAERWKILFPKYEDLFREMAINGPKWTLDQDILTKKLLEYGVDKIDHRDRGIDLRTGYPIGRVDRSNWRTDHPVLIDCHMPHDILTSRDSYGKLNALLHQVWPKEDFTWWMRHYQNFPKDGL